MNTRTRTKNNIMQIKPRNFAVNKRVKPQNLQIISSAMDEISKEMAKNNLPEIAWKWHGAWMKILRIYDYLQRPQRIQRKRVKGFKLQAASKAVNGRECVYVGRPGRFGNPYWIGSKQFNIRTKTFGIDSIEDVLNSFEFWLQGKLQFFPTFLDELKGKNLACFCGLSDKCHADILLEYANR